MFFEFSGISECYKPEHLTVFLLFVFFSHLVIVCILVFCSWFWIPARTPNPSVNH